MKNTLFIISFNVFLFCFQQVESEYWISSTNTSLTYRTTNSGDRIMDFSPVGYLGNDSPTPHNITPYLTLTPSQSALIQQAIDNVSALPIQPCTGLRGLILLSNGTFDVRGRSFTISSTGVVIRGSPETVLNTTYTDGKALFTVKSVNETIAEVGSRAAVIESVPSGADHVVVNSTAEFNPGDAVLLHWPQTLKWIQMLNMTSRWGNQSETSVERLITEVDRETGKVFLDIQVPFRIDLTYLTPEQPAYLVKINVSGRVENVGLESFKAVQTTVPPHGAGTFLNLLNVQDSWVKNVVAVNFDGDTMTIAGKRITVDNLRLIRSASPPTGAKPADIAIQFPGSQILVKNTVIYGGGTEFNFMTRNGANGPNVFFNCTGYGTAHAQPHSHFATGILYDNMNFPSGGSIDLIRRDYAHHGYTSAYSVVWSSRVSVLNVISPPQAVNWAIGCVAHSVGIFRAEIPGYIEPRGVQSAALSSLYLAQKAARRSS